MERENDYRDYKIYFDPKPVPPRIAGSWSYVHEGYDGAPDSGDHRCGDGDSVEDCKVQIDERIMEEEEECE